jgi:hypothetical protein
MSVLRDCLRYAMGEATPHIGVCGDNDGFRQRYKCTKKWCRTEFDIVFRADFAENIIVPEDVVKEWQELEAAAGKSDFEDEFDVARRRFIDMA